MGPEVGADRAGLGRAPSCPGQLPAWRGLFGFRDGGEGAGPGAEPELLEESLGHERVLPPRPRQRVCTPVLTFVVRSGGWGEVTPASSSENGLSTARGHGLLGDSGHTGGSSLKLMVLPGGPREAELFKTGKPRLGMGGQWAPWPRLDGVPWPAEDNPVGLPDPPT